VAELWSLIEQVYAVHPDAKKTAERPEIAAVARITVAAWHTYNAHVLQQQLGARSGASVAIAKQTPTWILELCQNFGLASHDSTIHAPEDTATPAGIGIDPSLFLPAEFDFDLIDWSIWEEISINTEP
jgi:hypothetical protein